MPVRRKWTVQIQIIRYFGPVTTATY